PPRSARSTPGGCPAGSRPATWTPSPTSCGAPRTISALRTISAPRTTSVPRTTSAPRATDLARAPAPAPLGEGCAPDRSDLGADQQADAVRDAHGRQPAHDDPRHRAALARAAHVGGDRAGHHQGE